MDVVKKTKEMTMPVSWEDILVVVCKTYWWRMRPKVGRLADTVAGKWKGA